jgi:hypothetical protein
VLAQAVRLARVVQHRSGRSPRGHAGRTKSAVTELWRGSSTAIFAELASTFAGRSMLRPYGIVVRQGASGSRKREQAPALHRILATRFGVRRLAAALRRHEILLRQGASESRKQAGNQMFRDKPLVLDADRSSITICGLVLSCWTRTGLGLPIALGIAVALCIAITLSIAIALCVAVPLSILIGIRSRRALWSGLTLRSRGAAYSQQHQKTRSHK